VLLDAPSFRMSKFYPTVTVLGPQPLEDAVMPLLRRRVPTGKPPLARRRRRGAHNNGGEGGLCTEAQKSATNEAKSDRGGSTDAASVTIAPGGERPDGLVTEGDSAPGGRGEYKAEGKSVWAT
jgi:hypothetical protein